MVIEYDDGVAAMAPPFSVPVVTHKSPAATTTTTAPTRRFALLDPECKTALCDRKCNRIAEGGHRPPDHRVRPAAHRRARVRRVHDGRPGRGRGRLAADPVQLLPEQGRRRARARTGDLRGG